MSFSDTLYQAYVAIKTQRLRVMLIILAMSIGMTSVTVLTALGESARRYVMHEFEALGSHLIIVLPGRTETTGGQPPIFGETPRDLTLADAEALLRSHNIAAIAPVNVGAAPVSVKGLEREITVIGSTAALRQVRRLNMARGQFLPEADATQAASICVIGQTVKDELFSRQQALRL